MNNPNSLLSYYGAVKEKNYRGGTDMNYTYDIQSRLTKINNTGSASHPFSARYTYLDNGDIHRAEFRNPIQTVDTGHDRYRYSFGYDNLHRLQSAAYQHYSSGWQSSNRFKVDNMDYDAQGNIVSLRRYEEDASTIDDLTYTYAASNRLQSIADAVSTTSEDWDAEDATFGYDAGGNLTSQTGKFTGITYEHRNLPVEFTLDGGGKLVANYEAGGDADPQRI